MSSKQRSIARRMAALQLENEGFRRTHRHYRKKEDPEYEKKSFFAHNWKKAFRNKQKFDEKRRKK